MTRLALPTRLKLRPNLAFSPFLGGAGIPSIPGFSNFTGANLPNWSAARTAQLAGTRNSRIFAAGDSTTAGVGSQNNVVENNDIALSYPKQLADLLGGGWQNAIGTHNVVAGGSTTQLAFDFRYSQVDANWINQSIGTVGGVLNGNSTASAVMIWTPTTPIDTIEVFFARFASTGIITVQSDGVTIGTVNTAGATGTGKQVLTTTLGTHALGFIGSSAGAQYINGIIAYNSAAKQPLVINGGALSWTSGNIAGGGQGQTNWPYPQGVNAMTPDVVLLSVGINDWNSAITIPQYKTNLASSNSQLVGTSDLIFMSPPPGDPTQAQPSYATQQTYVDGMKAQAYALGRPFIDVWRLFGGVYQPTLMFDAKHPKAAGYAQIAAAVQQALAAGFRSP